MDALFALNKFDFNILWKIKNLSMVANNRIIQIKTHASILNQHFFASFEPLQSLNFPNANSSPITCIINFITQLVHKNSLQTSSRLFCLTKKTPKHLLLFGTRSQGSSSPKQIITIRRTQRASLHYTQQQVRVQFSSGQLLITIIIVWSGLKRAFPRFGSRALFFTIH